MRYNVISTVKGREYLSNDFRHRFTGYSTVAEAERWAEVVRRNSPTGTVEVRPR